MAYHFMAAYSKITHLAQSFQLVCVCFLIYLGLQSLNLKNIFMRDYHDQTLLIIFKHSDLSLF